MTTKSLFRCAAIAALAAIAVTPAFAQDSGVSTTITLDYVSEYVFRGVSFEAEAIQPGVELGFGNFAVGAWASTGLGSDSQADTDEVDVYASYSFPLADRVTGSVGATWYHFPDAGDTFEAYVGLGLDTALSPVLTAYYDVELDAFTLEGGVAHSIATGGKTSFDLGLVGGFVSADGPGDYEWATASAALSYTINAVGSVYAGVNYTINSEELLDFADATPDDDLVWAGVGIAAGF